MSFLPTDLTECAGKMKIRRGFGIRKEMKKEMRGIKEKLIGKDVGQRVREKMIKKVPEMAERGREGIERYIGKVKNKLNKKEKGENKDRHIMETIFEDSSDEQK